MLLNYIIIIIIIIIISFIIIIIIIMQNFELSRLNYEELIHRKSLLVRASREFDIPRVRVTVM